MDNTHCVIRAVTIPIAKPVDGDWDALRKTLDKGWRLATSVCNYLATTLYANDVTRDSSMGDKMPKYPRELKASDLNLYRLVRDKFPELSSGVASTLVQVVLTKYKAQRFQTVWLANESLVSYRFPQPLPIRKQDLKLWEDDNGELHFSAPILGERIEVLLKRGKCYHRQLAQIRDLIKRQAFVECRIVGPKKNQAARELTLTIVGKFPKKEKRTTGVRARLSTDADCFLRCVVEGEDQAWVVNADKHKDRIYQHTRNRQRIAEDLKHERRSPKKRKVFLQEDLEAKCSKFHNRTKSFLQETVAHVVGYLKRRGVESCTYDDTVQLYFHSFPWFQFRQMLISKADAEGVDITKAEKEKPKARGKAAKKTLPALAESEVQQ